MIYPGTTEQMPAAKNNNKPPLQCILDVLLKVEKGTTNKADADYLLAVLIHTNNKIAALESRLKALASRLH